jgi:hypothetical protein
MIAAAGPYILPESWPAWLLGLGAVVAAAGWLALYRLSRRGPTAEAEGLWAWLRHANLLALMAGRLLLAAGGLWLAMQALSRPLLLTTNWPLWPLAALGAVLGEVIIWLYGLERRTVDRRMGALLTALRLLLLMILLLLILQPAWASATTSWRKRPLAILLDESASMRIADRQLPGHEKLRLAESLSVEAARRPHRLDVSAERARALARAAADELAWLDRLARSRAAAPAEQLLARRKELHGSLSEWAEAARAEADRLDAVLAEPAAADKALQANLRDAKAALGSRAGARLTDAAAWTHEDREDALAGNLGKLRKALRASAGALSDAAEVLDKAGEALDEALYARLAAEDRRAVDAVAGLTRRELAVAALLHRPARSDDDEPAPSLLDRLREDYQVEVFTFGAELAEAEPEKWTNPLTRLGATATAPATAPADEAAPARPPVDPRALRTDVAGALRELLGRHGGRDLAGVWLMSDGRHNAPGNPELLARQLGAQGSALVAAVCGSRRPPPDAAIVTVDAPETIFLADKVFLDVEVKLDGLAGEEAKVTLFDGGKPLDSRTLRPSGDAFRAHVQLADEPKKVGLRDYRVEVRPADEKVEEVFPDNNEYALSVSVIDEKTKVLLLDDRPRWEFRYLRNLFTGRDKTVQLQYVLLHPDRIAGQKPRPVVHASASRKGRHNEATALPKDESEWMKFDVIILGDVGPEALGPRLSQEQRKDPAAVQAARQGARKNMQVLRRFVADRGGTLVFVAGPRAMPAAHAVSPLAELIPLELVGEDATREKRLSRRGFRVRPTPVGTGHVLLHQDADPEVSAKIWNSLPPIYWRSRYTRARRASEVLAYALDPDAPKWLTDSTPPASAAAAADLQRRREEYRRSHALITAAPHGLGKVLAFSFDRTWRLRYRIGDTRHHRLWGQVIRWATAGELPAGTRLVKLGTDRTRYPARSRPRVRAKLVREDLSPIITEQVAIKVFSDGELLSRVPMRYVQDSRGMYTAVLEELPAGAYRLELDAPAATKLLAGEGVEQVSTEIAIDPAAPTEQIELAANPDVLGRMAALSFRGATAPLHRLERLREALPEGTVAQPRRRELSLREGWPPWVLLALFCLVATAEWMLRKRVGLA